MGGTLGFWRWLSPRELCLARSYMKPAQSIRLPSKCSNPSVTAARIMPSALRGLVCALPLFFEVAIVLLISVAFSMARHTGTNPGEAGNPIIRRRGGRGCVPLVRASANAPRIADERRFWLDDPDWPVCGNSGNDYCRAAVGVISSAATWSCIFLTTSANRISAKAKCHLSDSACR